MARVLVTRPEPGASATAARLAAMGHAPLVLPLGETRPLAVTPPPPEAIDAVAATSANAFRFLPPGQARDLAGKPCFAVGARTARAARKAGFADVRFPGGDGAALAAMIAALMPPASRILYLCGRERRPEFEAALASAEIACIAVQTYDIVFPEPDPDRLRAIGAAGPADVALVYSAASARALAALAVRPEAAQFFEKTLFLCLSPSVARGLGTIDGKRIYWSGAPTEDALFTLLPAD